jgi:hypothetical protein
VSWVESLFAKKRPDVTWIIMRLVFGLVLFLDFYFVLGCNFFSFLFFFQNKTKNLVPSSAIASFDSFQVLSYQEFV